MGVTDRRVKVPGTNIKVKHHRVLAAVARYLAVKGSALSQELMHNATMRNGRPIFHYVKGVTALTSVLKCHPHFANYKDKVDGRLKAHWFLADKETYLLGEGQAFPAEYYDTKTNKKKPEAF
tara:strand:+ start:174 stop:539 length:366 start_codon:yes stop_codon:yes gene_type:complete